MNRKKRRMIKRASLVLAIIFLVSCTISFTIAFLIDKTNEKSNLFTPSEVTCAVDEPTWKDGYLTKSDVSIKNTGDIDAYIRATIVVTWQNADGHVWREAPKAGTDYELVLNDTAWDVQTSDGYYYYPNVVAPEENTDVLINSCVVLTAAPEAGYTLHVEVIASAIQSTPATVVTEAWGVTVTAGKISK